MCEYSRNIIISTICLAMLINMCKGMIYMLHRYEAMIWKWDTSIYKLFTCVFSEVLRVVSCLQMVMDHWMEPPRHQTCLWFFFPRKVRIRWFATGSIRSWGFWRFFSFSKGCQFLYVSMWKPFRVYLGFAQIILPPAKFNWHSPLKSYQNPIGKDRLQPRGCRWWFGSVFFFKAREPQADSEGATHFCKTPGYVAGNWHRPPMQKEESSSKSSWGRLWLF